MSYFVYDMYLCVKYIVHSCTCMGLERSEVEILYPIILEIRL